MRKGSMLAGKRVRAVGSSSGGRVNRGVAWVEPLESRWLLTAVTTGQDFFGPLGGWIQVSPSGDASGVNDTAALQAALNEVGTAGYSSTVYLNAGTYYLNQSLIFRGKSECSIIGADPATTILQWAGPTLNSAGNAMLVTVGNTICQVNRLTLNGNNQIDDGVLDGYQPSQLSVGALGTLGNSGASGFYGLSVTTENTPLKIQYMQRWIPANTTTTQSHMLEIVDAATQAVVGSGTISAGYVGGPSGHFSGIGFPGDIVLQPNHTYYILSQEYNGGDPWYSDTTAVTPDHVSIASVNGSVSNVGGSFHIVTAGNVSFGPLMFHEDLTSSGDPVHFPTNNAFTDDHIENFEGTLQTPGHGFTAGIFAAQASETLLERDTFSYCGTNTGNPIGTGGGIYLFGQNTIDWWVRDCEFDHDSVGIVTNFGGYSLQVDNSVFNSDSLVDLYLPEGYSTAVRDTTSIDSNQFIEGQSSSDILQNDTIIDPASTTLAPISLPGGTQLTLLNTTVRNNAAYSGPDVMLGTDGDILSEGNTFGVATASVSAYNPFSAGFGTLLRSIGDQTVDRTSSGMASLAPQALPPTPAALSWTPIELLPTGNAATDTSDIDNAIKAAKANIDAGAAGAVIHLQDRNSSGAFTSFSINQTVIIPAGYPIELVGDGEAWSGGLPGTAITWSGPSGGTMIDLGGATLGVAAGPSDASLGNLGILSGNTAGDGVRIENADQANGSVYADDALTSVSGNSFPVEYTQAGVFADGISNTNISLVDFQSDGASNVKVVGNGGSTGGGGNVGVFMGAGSSEAVQYAVSNGGKLLVEDQYLEEDSGATNQWAQVDNGTYTVQGAIIKANVAGVDAANPPISVSGNSTASILSSAGAAGFVIQPGSSASVLAAGDGQWSSVSGNVNGMGPFGGPLDYGASAQVALVENANAPDQINANIASVNAFMSQMLAQTLNFHPGYLSQTRSRTVTDVRLFNIQVSGAVNDIHVVGTSPTPAAYNPAAPTAPAAPTNVTAFPSGAGGSQIDVSYQPGGTHLLVVNNSIFNAHSVGEVNNYTGFVGTQFTTGAKPILVTQLGRFVVGGNSQSHTLEIVQASTHGVIAQATLQTSAAQENNFAYVSLSQPVMLSPNTVYYLVSSETNGGDFYVPGWGVYSTSLVKTVDGIVTDDSTNGWKPNLVGSVAGGPVDLVATELPDMAGEGLTQGVKTNGLGAGTGIYQGLQFTTGSQAVGVAYLGRWVPAATTTAQSHTLELVDATTGGVIASAVLAAGQPGGANGQFEYAPLGSAITLAAHHSYYLVSDEASGGDGVCDFSQMRPSGLIASIDGVVTQNGSAWSFNARPGFADGPLDFLGQVDRSAVSYSIYRSTSRTMSGAVAIATGLTTTSYIDASAAAGVNYYYTVQAVNGSGSSATLGEGSASRGTALPGGWSDSDIGAPPIAGSAWTNGGDPTSFTVQGSGSAYTNQWNYAYEVVGGTGSYVPGSFTATVQLTGLTAYGNGVGGYGEYLGALMIRDGLSPNSQQAFVDVNSAFTQWRAIYGAAEPMPIYLQLQANYDPSSHNYTVYGYYLNGAGQPIEPYQSYNNPATIISPSTLYIGLAADSNGAPGVTTATFAHFSVVYGNNAPPNTPGNVSPANGATVQSPTSVTLSASAFSDPNSGDTQAAAEWIVTRVSDNSTVYDSGTDANDLTSLTLTTGLATQTAYSWKVRYQDNHGAWSNYSMPTTFTLSATVATPTFTTPGGSYVSSASVSLSDTTAGAVIHYTTDGSTPTASSATYSGALTVTATETIKAIAVENGFTNSAIASVTYTIDSAKPAFTPAAGTYVGSITVKIADATPGAAIHFTTDGSTPTASSPVYSAPFSLSASKTVKAIAIKSGTVSSAIASAAYVFAAAAPTFSSPAGNYLSSVTVTLKTATAGAVIHYTLNGSTPTLSSPVYTGAFTLKSTATVKAIAIKSGLATSSVASAVYPIVPPSSVTLLTSGKSVSNLSGAQSSQHFFEIVVPSGKTKLTLTLTGGTGNANLFLRRSSLPSTLIYDQKSTSATNADSINLANPVAGTYYVLLYGAKAFSGATLKVVLS